jgi:hypothetical protein
MLGVHRIKQRLAVNKVSTFDCVLLAPSASVKTLVTVSREQEQIYGGHVFYTT